MLTDSAFYTVLAKSRHQVYFVHATNIITWSGKWYFHFMFVIFLSRYQVPMLLVWLEVLKVTNWNVHLLTWETQNLKWNADIDPFIFNLDITCKLVVTPHNRPNERPLPTHCIGIHLGPVADLEVLEKNKIQTGPGSVVGKATAYGLDGPGIESRWGRDFPHLSRPALRPT
jgi:hypothetical protein